MESPSTPNRNILNRSTASIAADNLTGERSDPLVSAQVLDPGFQQPEAGALKYPTAARRLKRQGRVRLAVEVDTTGNSVRVEILEETAGWGFGQAARQAYAGARFTPPTHQGRPVRVRWLKTVQFTP